MSVRDTVPVAFVLAAHRRAAPRGPATRPGRSPARSSRRPGRRGRPPSTARTTRNTRATVDPGVGQVHESPACPLGATFDCLIDFQGGARLEGVNLKVPRSEYEEEQPLSAEDAETIKEKVRHLNKFEDEVDVLAVAGNIQHAAVVVNKLRTRPFVNSKPGEVVWRCELWKFERPEETWVKVQDELFLVLYRERIPHAVYAKKSVTFDPALGGLDVDAGDPEGARSAR